jgi:hypothetical protein
MTAMILTMTIDRHRYITTLRNAGMDETLASAHAQGLSEALHVDLKLADLSATITKQAAATAVFSTPAKP